METQYTLHGVMHNIKVLCVIVHAHAVNINEVDSMYIRIHN